MIQRPRTLSKGLFLFLALLLVSTKIISQDDRALDSLVEILPKLRNDTNKLKALAYLSVVGDQAECEGNSNKTIQLADELLKVHSSASQAIKNRILLEKATGLSSLGYALGNVGENEKALAAYRSSLDLNLKMGNKTNASAIYQLMADVYVTIGRTDVGLEYYNYSLKMRQEQGDKRGIAEVLGNLAIVYEQQGDMLKSMEQTANCIKIQEEVKDSVGLGTSLNNLGSVYSKQGDVIKAMEYYKKGYAVNLKTGSVRGILSSLANIGTNFSRLNAYDSAFTYFSKEAILAEKNNSKSFMANAYSNLSNVYGYKMDFEKAQQLMERCLKINEEIDDKFGIANALNKLAITYSKLNKFEKAYALAMRSLSLSKEYGYIEKVRNAELNLTAIDSARGNFTGAFLHHKEYIKYRDSLSNNKLRKASVRTQFQYEYEKKSLADSIRVNEEKKTISFKLEAEKTKSMALYFIISLIMIFSVFIINRYRLTIKQKKIIEQKEQETQKQNIIITEQKIIVEEKHKEITDSINYAERIQRSFLATKQLLDENLLREDASDYFVLFKPKDVVSGDFYWAGKLSNDNFAIVTADSTGHGVPGAIMSILNISSIEKAVEMGLTNSSDILDHTRKTIIQRLKKDGSVEGGKDGMDCSLCVYDFSNKKLSVSVANNPVWVIRSVNGNKELIEFKPDKMPVGKHDRQEVSFTQQQMELQKGDIVYTLTDGFPDQFGGLRGKKFLIKNLRELLMTNCYLPMAEQKALLESTFEDWLGDLEQIDDVTIIGIRI
ncbi:MAG: tetratricopeptide repeat protein [Bacteroidota bacterium]|nr:tetratricopeptide repeat protein [Bacteroidota bacterium]